MNAQFPRSNFYI